MAVNLKSRASIGSTSNSSGSSGSSGKSSVVKAEELRVAAAKVVQNLFAHAQVDRTTFQLRPKQTVPPTLEQYIEPLRLSKEELLHRTNLGDIVMTESFSSVNTNITFPPFPRDLEAFLELKPPEKVEIHHVMQSSKIFQPILPKVQPKPLRIKSSEGPTRLQRERKRGGQFQTSSLPEFGTADDDSSRLTKRFKGGGEGDEEEYDGDEGEAEPEVVMHSNSVPLNLQYVINEVFNEYWEMEFDDKVVHAFLAKISKFNCVEYGLSDFASESHSLPVIKEKLKEGRYGTVEAFYYDFSLMFQNVLMYYPPDHPAHAKAGELLKHFEVKWEHAKSMFRY